MTGIDPGDEAYRHGDTIEMPSDGTGEAGDVVVLSGGQVSNADAADGDKPFGVLSEDAPAAGEDVTVHTGGVVYANVAAGATDGLIGVDGSGPILDNTDSAGGAVTADVAWFALEAEGATLDGAAKVRLQ